MKLQQFGSNQTVVTFGDVTVFFSYNTPVAAFVPGVGYVRTATKHSVTTSKHINGWLAGATAQVRDQSFFDTLAESAR